MNKIFLIIMAVFYAIISAVRSTGFSSCVGKQIINSDNRQDKVIGLQHREHGAFTASKISSVGKQLTNSKMVSILGMPLTNANGAIDPATTGFDYVTRTTSEIRAEIIEQTFYEVAPADFMPVDVGEAAWKDEIIQNLTYDLAGDFFQGDVDTLTGNGRISEVGTAMAPIRMKTVIWAKAAKWNVSEVSQAAASSNWDPIEGKMSTLKRNWDLGIQEVAFLGHPTETTVTGLLNNSEVTINTTLITKSLTSMSETEFTTFIGAAIGVYFANTNSTTLPDTFLLPTDDFLGLTVPYSATYPNISKIAYMQDAFEKATANSNFQIKSLAYCQSANNAIRGIDKERYVFYKNEKKTLKMTIPVDFNMFESRTTNGLFWEQPAMGQYSGVLINKVPEVLYCDY